MLFHKKKNNNNNKNGFHDSRKFVKYDTKFHD